MPVAKQFTAGTLLTFGVVSDSGGAHRVNEDAVAIDETAGIAVVADGLGGNRGGAQASACVAATVARMLRRHLLAFAGPSINAVRLDDADLRMLVRGALLEAHAEVLDAANGSGMASTVVVLFIHGGSAVIGWVGDSACYRVAETGVLVRLTRNHNLAAATGRNDRLKSVLTAAIGGTTGVFAPSISRIAVKNRDLFILCSDGLTDELPDEEIRAIAIQHKDRPELLAHSLVDAANRHGDHDNVTVAVVRIVNAAPGWGDDDPQPGAGIAAAAGARAWHAPLAALAAGLLAGAGGGLWLGLGLSAPGKSAVPARPAPHVRLLPRPAAMAPKPAAPSRTATGREGGHPVSMPEDAASAAPTGAMTASAGASPPEEPVAKPRANAKETRSKWRPDKAKSSTQSIPAGD